MPLPQIRSRLGQRCVSLLGYRSFHCRLIDAKLEWLLTADNCGRFGKNIHPNEMRAYANRYRTKPGFT